MFGDGAIYDDNDYFVDWNTFLSSGKIINMLPVPAKRCTMRKNLFAQLGISQKEGICKFLKPI